MEITLTEEQRQELEAIVARPSEGVRSWLAANPLVHFHYAPTSASWLNQVEGFFGILGKQSLGRTDIHSKRALRDHLDAYMRAWNKSPTPFAWDEAGGRDHQVTPSDAEAHLDGGVLQRVDSFCQHRPSRASGVSPSCFVEGRRDGPLAHHPR
ncbi:MAG TPA: hypothetical protein VI072_33930 [Polyangiaceae bacterium]